MLLWDNCVEYDRIDVAVVLVEEVVLLWDRCVK